MDMPQRVSEGAVGLYHAIRPLLAVEFCVETCGAGTRLPGRLLRVALRDVDSVWIVVVDRWEPGGPVGGTSYVLRAQGGGCGAKNTSGKADPQDGTYIA